MKLGWALFACVLLACAPAAAERSTGDANRLGEGSGDGPQTPGPADPVQMPTPAPSCDAAETTRLQSALDAAHGAGTDAVLAVKTVCGLRFFTSGPSKVDGKALHRIGSVTKTYVAGVVLSFVSDGAVRLDDPVSRFVAGVPNGNAISVRQLLNHTSGLFAYTDDADFLALMSPTRRFTPQELLDFGIRNAPRFAPGAGWSYSNTNFVLLGMIAEAVGKAPIASLVRTRILDRLQLKETFFAGEETFGAFTLARGKDVDGNDVTDVADISWAWAAGAMAATPADVARWMEQVGSGAFYTLPVQQSLLTLVETDTPGDASGLGIFVLSPEVTIGAGRGIGHDGGLTGFNTRARHFPARKATVVAIADSDAEDSNAALAGALEVLAPP